jgi:adenylosuccinate lyase
VKSEQLCGLARVLRADLMAGMKNVALWHERDISHSSVERVILPDACLLAYYLLVKMRAIVEGMVVYPERMLENLDASYGLVFSQPVLLAIVESGRARDDAYRMVQRNAMKTWEERRPFLDVLREDPEVTGALSAATLEACFDLKRAVANVGRTFDVLDA